MLRLAFHSLLFLATIACVQRRAKQPLTNELNPKSRLSLSFNEKFSPVNAQVELDQQVELREFLSDGLKVPTLGFTMKNATFIQILRCDQKYHSFFDSQQSSLGGSSISERKWSWYDAFGNTQMCKIGTRKHRDIIFEDITATSGSYFYIINPCVDEFSSTTGKEACSYQLQYTEVFKYDGDTSRAFSIAASELVDAEAQYDELMNKLRSLTGDLLNEQNSCENELQEVASKERKDAFNNTMITLGSTLAAGAVFFGVRALARRSRTSAAPQPPANQRNLPPGKARALGKDIGIAGLFAGVGSVALFLQGVLQKRSSTSQACEKMAATASQILAIEKSQQIELARESVISKSITLQRLGSRFEAYSQDIFYQ